MHYARTLKLFAHYQPEANSQQVLDFCKGTFYGCRGNYSVLPILSAISCMEGGFKTKRSLGWMGGHKLTILAGSRVLDGNGVHDWKWLKRNPVHVNACLSAQFCKLYRIYGREKAIRSWNKGLKWRCKTAGKYYNGVEKLVKEYNGGSDER